MPVTPYHAASILLLRDADPAPQIFMLRRSPKSSFWANALVFVGGRLDTADRETASRRLFRGSGEHEAAAALGEEDGVLALSLYVAAIRECFEEAGILLAERPAGVSPLSVQERAELRARLLAKESGFAALLEENDLRLSFGALRFLERWITPEFEHRRYDTRFFLCRAPEAQEALVSTDEASSGGWFTAEEILAGGSRNEFSLAPPTLVILERLRGLSSVDEILRAPPAGHAPYTMPRPLIQQGDPVLLLPGDHRYQDPASPSGPEEYVVLSGGHWSLVRRAGG
jgi:8-oxo-dGTP pyrophosphatase MutT (NUDIX family)